MLFLNSKLILIFIFINQYKTEKKGRKIFVKFLAFPLTKHLVFGVLRTNDKYENTIHHLQTLGNWYKGCSLGKGSGEVTSRPAPCRNEKISNKLIWVDKSCVYIII